MRRRETKIAIGKKEAKVEEVEEGMRSRVDRDSREIGVISGDGKEATNE